MLCEDLLSKVVYRDKEKVAWRMMRVLMEQSMTVGQLRFKEAK